MTERRCPVVTNYKFQMEKDWQLPIQCKCGKELIASSGNISFRVEPNGSPLGVYSVVCSLCGEIQVNRLLIPRPLRQSLRAGYYIAANAEQRDGSKRKRDQSARKQYAEEWWIKADELQRRLRQKKAVTSRKGKVQAIRPESHEAKPRKIKPEELAKADKRKREMARLEAAIETRRAKREQQKK
ncbi:MAG: hypothetical protein V1763_01655 [Parcubacteria group bacterium]